MLPGLTRPVRSIARVNASPRGHHYAGIVRLDNPNTDDPVLVLDGMPVVVQGNLVRPGQPVDPASGSGETWFRIYAGHATRCGWLGC